MRNEEKMSQNYLNIYVFALFGALASTLFGIFIFYSGVSDSSYLSYMGSEIKTFYLNKSQYDLYLYGLVYCLTFGTAIIFGLLNNFNLLRISVVEEEEGIDNVEHGGHLMVEVGDLTGTTALQCTFFPIQYHSANTSVSGINHL